MGRLRSNSIVMCCIHLKLFCCLPSWHMRMPPDQAPTSNHHFISCSWWLFQHCTIRKYSAHVSHPSHLYFLFIFSCIVQSNHKHACLFMPLGSLMQVLSFILDFPLHILSVCSWTLNFQPPVYCYLFYSVWLCSNSLYSSNFSLAMSGPLISPNPS